MNLSILNMPLRQLANQRVLNEFIINGRKYDADELVTKLNSSVIRKHNRTIAINVDKESKMGVVTKAISTFKRLGFVKLAIITKQDHP